MWYALHLLAYSGLDTGPAQAAQAAQAPQPPTKAPQAPSTRQNNWAVGEQGTLQLFTVLCGSRAQEADLSLTKLSKACYGFHTTYSVPGVDRKRP